MIQRWPSPIFILLLLLLCNRKRDLVTRREKVTCQRSISFYLFFFLFFSLLFFLHFTCCNFISFEDKSFHYGSRCFVTFVLVSSRIRWILLYCQNCQRMSMISFVIFIIDIYQGICLEQSTNCEKNIRLFESFLNNYKFIFFLNFVE